MEKSRSCDMGSDTNKRSRWRTISLAAVLLSLPSVMLYYNQHIVTEARDTIHTAVEKYIPSWPQSSINEGSIQKYEVKYLDIDEGEYIRLGLTPNKPVQIIPLDGDHNHRSPTIHGRFLHITDIHPDDFYVTGTDSENACHRGKPEGGGPGASKYGDATIGCDSPMILMNETMEWISANLRDKIDFVIWTGDNIRHDNDRKIPRTEMAILDMNRKMAEIFHDIFHGDQLDPRHYDVPVVPSLGNNDVYPHNLFSPGPTLQTREMWNIWQSFVPQEQMHVFEKGAYFFQEVVPNKLAILSINTLYLYKANPLVDSCDRKRDPGYELLKWLGVTLQELRERRMKVWLSGHVPPILKNYDISCYRKFAIWTHEYRDIIIGGVYGHMNIDHFIPIDSQKAYKSYQQSLLAQGYEDYRVYEDYEEQEEDYDGEEVQEEEEGEEEEEEEDYDSEEVEYDVGLESQYLMMGVNVSEHDLNVAIAANEARAMGGPPTNKEAYMDSVREIFYADLKSRKKSGLNFERYSITTVAASVIPTFNPGMRIWEYNITGIESEFSFQPKPWAQFFQELDLKMLQDDDDDDDEEEGEEEEEEEGNIFADITARKKRKKGKKKKQDPSIPLPMPKDAELGPGYTPQTFSPLRFVQYYLDLKAINKGEKPFDYEVEYTSDGGPYRMKSLLVEDYIKLGKKLGQPLKTSKSTVDDSSANKSGKSGKDKNTKLEELWETFKKHAFVSSGYHDE